MKLHEPFPGLPFGELHYEIRRRGRVIEVCRERNLIVDNSKQIHARLLGGDVINRSVTKFGVGTNGAAPAGGNTTLTTSYSKALDGVTYPASNQVQFAFSLGSIEANGKAILELGLLTSADVLYARRVRNSALNKESDISFAGVWIITFP